MNTNNAILFTLLLIFLGLAIVSPLISAEFNLPEYDVNNEDFEADNLDSDLTSTTALILNIFLIPFWTFGLPVWLNLSILLAMRIVFMVILYDKIRGI